MAVGDSLGRCGLRHRTRRLLAHDHVDLVLSLLNFDVHALFGYAHVWSSFDVLVTTTHGVRGAHIDDQVGANRTQVVGDFSYLAPTPIPARIDFGMSLYPGFFSPGDDRVRSPFSSTFMLTERSAAGDPGTSR